MQIKALRGPPVSLSGEAIMTERRFPPPWSVRPGIGQNSRLQRGSAATTFKFRALSRPWRSLCGSYSTIWSALSVVRPDL